ncbi:MAG: DUF4190 domain-containing protein [Solirubrobacterales bacterium]|nr:DUF4190 domain-containing protein [Solirubrobacterales bacterium]
MSDAFGRGDEPERDAFGNEVRPEGHQWLGPQTPEPGQQQPPQQEAWQPPVAPPGAAPGRTPGEATGAMILGILGVIFCPLVLSVPAIVLGTRARREIDGAGGTLGGRGQAVTGIVLGWVGTGFGALVLLLILIGALVADGGS